MNLSSTPMAPTLEGELGSLGGLVKRTDCWTPAQELLIQWVWGEAQEFALPKGPPSDAGAAGPRTTLSEPLI